MLSFTQFLTEKLIVLNNGNQYGQVVFMGGGAGSGKGFAVSHFMEGDKFRVFDVDQLKQSVLKLERIHREYLMTPKQENPFSAAGGLNLKNPKDVFALHQFVKSKKWNDKLLDLFLTTASNNKALPNIIFDTTLKDFDDFSLVVPKLINIGYDPRNIHFIWVLTNFSIALKRNTSRERVVCDDILLLTHAGAADTITKIIFNKMLPRTIDGSGYVILSNEENTIFYDGTDGQKLNGATTYFDKSGAPVSSANVVATKTSLPDATGKTATFYKHKMTGEPLIPKKRPISIKDFTYLQVKETGKPIKSESEFKHNLFKWVYQNIPSKADVAMILNRIRSKDPDAKIPQNTYQTIAKASKKIDNIRSRRSI